ncbi:MAG TPA: M36 family metallopeptidase [Nocardioides sp.]|uniref:M36 family metallopeptidase n=1 Tax=Nocardioides sp. TaxID=35761 RepID=UPI002F42B720
MGSTAVTIAMLGVPSMADTGHQRAPSLSGTSDMRGTGGRTAHTPEDFDHRDLSGTALVKAQRAVAHQQSTSAEQYFAGLGGQAIVDIDPLTGTPRQLGRLDGFLTGPHQGSARTIALDFVKSHLDALGLTSRDLSTFVFRKDYVDQLGMHHLSWQQRVDGTLVFGNGLQVNVTRDGRVLSVLGSPVSGLADLARQAPASRVDAAQARSHAATNVHGSVQSHQVTSSSRGASATTRWANHDYATKVWFLTSTGLRPGWSTYVQTGDGEAYQHVIDAATGKALYRHSTVDKASGDAYVYDYYPGAPAGPLVNGHRTQPGAPKVVNFFEKGWLTKGDRKLDGRSVITWADLNDDNRINGGEQTAVPGKKNGATGKLVIFTDTQKDVYPPDGTFGGSPYSDYDFSKFCTTHFLCTWDAETARSWRTNLEANENNAFYLANTYHDYLQNDAAIRFTPQAGNFTTAGGDPVLQQVLDGADVAKGMPDTGHIDNANMNTPPDGTPPVMQMYLWHLPGYPDDYDPYNPTSGAFDASVLLHEYTHGLSNRLVVDADGNSTLNSLQAGSMGEAWSDYYAMDYLVHRHFQKDTSADGQVFEGQYLMGGQRDSNGLTVPFRSMAMDCSVGSTSKACFDTYNPAANIQGGYTYGDLVAIGGSAEVHSSGEVWAQTLWDIRKALGHSVADTVITRGMSLSANDPSMLDMRNAILQADLVAYGGDHTATLWRIFANRGMGFFAASINSADTDVAEDFHLPPSPDTLNTDQYIQGTVTDSATGDPVAGATVFVAGFDDQLSTVTANDGTYTIGSTAGMYPGTYPKVVVQGPGYLTDSKSVTVPVGDHATANFSVQRDWAMSSGGGTVTDFNGPDYSAFGCGPSGAIDGSLGTGWGSTVGDDAGDPTGTFVPKHIVVKLPHAVDVTSFGVDPKATCGDSGSASTGDYSIEVSADGTSWATVAQGHFGEAARGHLNQVDPTGNTDGTQYVRFTILGDQVVEAARDNGDETGTFESICSDPSTQGGYSGCSFADMSELAVFGTPSP